MYLTGLQIDLTTKKTFPNFSIYYIYSCTTLSKTKENKKKHIVRTQNNIKHYLDAAHKKPCYKFFHQLDLQHRRVLHFVVLENHKAWPWSEILHTVWNIFSILSNPPTVRPLKQITSLRISHHISLPTLVSFRIRSSIHVLKDDTLIQCPVVFAT